MRISSPEAVLLSVRELDLLRSKGPWHVKELVALIRRTRDLRDKQRDLIQRQTIATAKRGSGKGGRSGSDNARTVAKERVLARAVEHFEKQLAAIDRDSTQARQQLDTLATTTRGAKQKSVSRTAAEKTPTVRKSTARKSTTPKTAARTSVRSPDSTRSSKARVALPRSGVGLAPIDAPSLR